MDPDLHGSKCEGNGFVPQKFGTKSEPVDKPQKGQLPFSKRTASVLENHLRRTPGGNHRARVGYKGRPHGRGLGASERAGVAEHTLSKALDLSQTSIT
jgi:hypothetical protein